MNLLQTIKPLQMQMIEKALDKVKADKLLPDVFKDQLKISCKGR